MINNKVKSRIKKQVATLLTFVMCASFFTLPNTACTITAKAGDGSEYTQMCIDENVKVLFIGDSRTVDMFSAEKSQIRGQVYNNITVYAMDGADYGDLKRMLKGVDFKDYDVVVSWMGANDRGNFSKYCSYYKKLTKKNNVNLVLCTVGYSDNRKLGDEGDILYYNDDIMKRYNKGLKKWANKNDIETINLYKYTKKNMKAREHNGVHYVPNPTVELWNYTVGKIEEKVEDMELGNEELLFQ